MTTKDLYEFVYRADTTEKIQIAKDWLRAHRDVLSACMYGELTLILDRTRKNLVLARIEELRQSQRVGDLMVDVKTGEVLAGA